MEHVLGVSAQPRPAFSFDKSLHETLRKFFEILLGRQGVRQVDLFGNTIAKEVKDSTKIESLSEISVSLDELIQIYDVCWVDDWYPNQEIQAEYRKRGKKFLTEYYNSLKVNPVTPVYLDRPFKLDLEDEGETYTISGVVDRVDSNEDGVELIDYRTGAAKDKKKLTTSDREQLLIYWLAVQQDGVQTGEKVFKASYLYLDGNTKVTFSFSDKEIEKGKIKILSRIKDVRSGKIKDKIYRCRTCGFNDFCEFREF
tara:strand:+ start:67 stop:831 length:765 start_codon:yes stop_codon:yes gene_type:complete